jgi:hypothetical protein
VTKKNSEFNKNKYHRVRAEAVAFLGGVCVFCGALEDLEFDHIDESDKSFNVSCRWSSNNFYEELSKCQLLCHECHLLKTLKNLPVIPHGTWGMVKRKCKCEVCHDFCYAYHKARKAKIKSL